MRRGLRWTLSLGLVLVAGGMSPGRGVPGDRPGRPRLRTPGLPSAKIFLTGPLSASYMRLRREAAGREVVGRGAGAGGRPCPIRRIRSTRAFVRTMR
jgi:hypothetical protein